MDNERKLAQSRKCGSHNDQKQWHWKKKEKEKDKTQWMLNYFVHQICSCGPRFLVVIQECFNP